LPTPLLEAERPSNFEHMDTRDFSRHIRLKEKVRRAMWCDVVCPVAWSSLLATDRSWSQANDAQKLEALLHEEFDYKNCAEPLEDRIKKAGRRAGTYYTDAKRS
jgi:hypothetical protein